MRKSALLAACGAALLLAPATASAQATPAPAPAIDPARKALAYELAQLLSGEAIVMTQVRRVFADALPKGLIADPNIAALEKERPGVVKAMIAAMEPVILRHMKIELPRLWERVTPIYATLGESDLREAMAFYRSPTGARVIDIMMAEVDYAPLFRGMAESGDYEVRSEDVNATLMTGASKVSAGLTPEQRAATVAFGASPAGRRIIALTPQVNAAMLTWTNEPSPALDAELEKVAVAALTDFMARPKP